MLEFEIEYAREKSNEFILFLEILKTTRDFIII